MKNRKKIRLLFNESFEELCVYAYSYLEDADEAKDIVQDVFVKLLQKKDVDNINNLKAYITTSVYHACLKALKGKKKFDSLEKDGITKSNIEASQGGEHSIIKEEIANNIYDKVNQLPEHCKKTFELCVVHGLKYAEAAEVMDVSVNTVKTHIKKSYRILRKSLAHIHILLISTCY